MLKSRIKVRLAELEMKQNDLAEQFNVSKQTVSGWVTGRIKPSLELAFRIAKVLNCRVDDLWEYKEG